MIDGLSATFKKGEPRSASDQRGRWERLYEVTGSLTLARSQQRLQRKAALSGIEPTSEPLTWARQKQRF